MTVFVVLAIVACGDDGSPNHDDDDGSGGSGASSNGGGGFGGVSTGSMTSTTGSLMTSSTGSMTTSSTGSMMTSTTTGGGCMPGAIESCYSGPANTEGVGTCAPGQQTCQGDGTFGPCEGEIVPATDDCETPDDEDCTGDNAVCQGPGSAEWIRVFGEVDADVNATSVRSDPSGNVYAVGSAGGIPGIAVDFGGGATITTPTGYFVRLDPTGATTLVTSPWSGASVLDPGPADFLASSSAKVGQLSFSGDAVVYENDFDGAPLDEWSFAYASDNGGSPDVCYALEYTQSVEASPHELTVTGIFRGSITMDGTSLSKDGYSHDVFYARFPEMGPPLYVETIQASKALAASHAVLPDGDIVLLTAGYGPFVHTGDQLAPGGQGFLLARIDGETAALEWSKWIPMGYLPSSCSFYREVEVVPFDDGSFAVLFGASNDVMTTVTIDGAPTTGVILIGRFAGDGTLNWAKGFSVTNPVTTPVIFGHLAAADDDTLVYGAAINGLANFGAGSIGGASSNEIRGIVVKLDGATGSLVWQRLFDSSTAIVEDVSAAPGGAVLVSGRFGGTMLASGQLLTSSGPWSAFVAKLAP